MSLFLIDLIKVLVVLLTLLQLGALMTWAERKQAALMQDRVGPNRINVLGFTLIGLIQPIADGIKMAMKEDFVPAGAHRLYHTLAPALSMFPAFVAFAVIPFGPTVHWNGHEIPLQIADLNVGILFVLAVSSLGVYGIALGGWASNNKYALLGAVRATAQMISYEIPMGLAIVGVVMVHGSLELDEIVRGQGAHWGPIPLWGIVTQFPGFLIFLTAAIAETKRTPFDLPEGESELVAGYNIEYSGLKWGMFFLGEFVMIVVVSGIVATLYLGGWQVPWLWEGALHLGLFDVPLPAALCVVLQVGSFAFKVVFLCWLQLLIRWSLPRFRYDQLMRLGWLVLMPLALANIFITNVVLVWMGSGS